MPRKRSVASKTRVDDWEPGEVREFRWLHPDLAPPEGFTENGEPLSHQHFAEDGKVRNRLVVRSVTDE